MNFSHVRLSILTYQILSQYMQIGIAHGFQSTWDLSNFKE
jgi:hypothetical protein